MSTLLKRLYAPRVFDVLFFIAGAVTIVGLIPGVGNNYPAVVPADDPVTKGAALIGVLLVSVILAILASRIDQKAADDFVFLVIMKSAFIAFYTAMFTVAIWEGFLRQTMGGLSAPVIVFVMIASWSLCYLYVRLRGTAAAS